MPYILVKIDVGNATKTLCKDCDVGYAIGGCPFQDIGYSQKHHSFRRHPDCVKLQKLTEKILKKKEINDNIPDTV